MYLRTENIQQMKSKCFTHNNVASVDTCNYCNATYCGSCLSTIGNPQENICHTCHQTLSNRFYESMLKRKKYIYIGYIILIISTYISYINWGNGTGNLSIALLLLILGFIFITKKRIVEMKHFLKIIPNK